MRKLPRNLKVLLATAAALIGFCTVPGYAQSRGLAAQPYASDRDNDVNDLTPPEVGSSFLTTTGLPLKITFNPEGDDRTQVQGGAYFGGFSSHSFLVHFTVDALGAADSTNGPFLAIIGTSNNGHGSNPVNLRIPLSSLPHQTLKSGYTRYFYVTPASLGHLLVTAMGVYVQADEQTTLGPYYLNNFNFNDVLLGKILSTQDLSPNFPF